MEKWVSDVMETLGELEAENPWMLLTRGKVIGRLDEARQLLYLQGTRKFGKPDGPTAAAIESMKFNIFGLEDACLRMVDPDVRTWEELLRGLVSLRPAAQLLDPDRPELGAGPSQAIAGGLEADPGVSPRSGRTA